MNGFRCGSPRYFCVVCRLGAFLFGRHYNTNRHVHISESIAAQTHEEVRNSSRNCANQSTFLSALGIINKRRWCKSWWGLMKPESNRSWIFLEFLWIVKERRIGVWKCIRSIKESDGERTGWDFTISKSPLFSKWCRGSAHLNLSLVSLFPNY